MEDYNSKYSGEEVDGLLDEIGNKVDKVEGKQLSTEDFTTALKNKLNGLSNYDDTTISQAVDKLRTDLDALVSGDTTTAIKTFNEVIAFLDGISDTEDLSGIIASIEQQIAGKMDSVTLAKVATSGNYDDLSNKPTIPAEQVNADWNATSGKAQILNKPTIPSDDSVVHKTGTETISGAKTFTGGVNLLGSGDSNAVTLSTNTRINVNGTTKTVLGFGSGTFYINHGDYKLLLRGKDARPTYNNAEMAMLSDVNGKYTKPSTGIPKTDLASAVQTSLGKADSALQEIPSDVVRSSNIKTINGESILGSGNIVISGGGGSSGGSSKEFVEVTPRQEPLGYYGDLGAIVPNNVYVFTRPINGIGVTAFEYSDSKGDEYSIMFTASEDNIPIRMPFGANIYWANGVIPIINSGDLCELSLLRIGSDIKAVLTTFKAV